MDDANDELLAAEAEFQARKRAADEDGWASAQPDSGMSSGWDAAGGRDTSTGADGGQAGQAGDGPRKKPKLSDAEKKRGNRMFGALMGTLSRFKDDSAKSKQSDAAKRRQDLEQRLQQKLRAETELLHKRRELELEERSLNLSVNRKADELGLLDHTHSARFASELSLANFLRTSYPVGEPSRPHSAPGSLSRQTPLQPRPLYYLPHKLLPEQEAQIEKQQREAKEAVDAQKTAWEAEKADKEVELATDKAKRSTRLVEIEAQRSAAAPKASSPARRASPDVKRPPPSRTPTPVEPEGPRLDAETSERGSRTPAIVGDEEDRVEY